MKTIEISDEMYNSLMDISKELNTQNHRSTRMPYFFQIREKEERVAIEGNGTPIWVDQEGDTLRDDEEIKDFLVAHFFDCFEEEFKGVDSSAAAFDSDITEEEFETAYCQSHVESLDESDIDELLVKLEYYIVWIEKGYKYHGAFFTEKACKQHITQNNYHYKDPIDYLSSNWRNPEMELVMQFLCELSGGKIHY